MQSLQNRGKRSVSQPHQDNHHQGDGPASKASSRSHVLAQHSWGLLWMKRNLAHTTERQGSLVSFIYGQTCSFSKSPFRLSSLICVEILKSLHFIIFVQALVTTKFH